MFYWSLLLSNFNPYKMSTVATGFCSSFWSIPQTTILAQNRRKKPAR